MIAPGFQSQDGLCFERLYDGRVHVRVVVPVLESGGPCRSQAVVFQTILPAASWASVMASVSFRGENGETFGEALRWHDNADEAALNTDDPGGSAPTSSSPPFEARGVEGRPA